MNAGVPMALTVAGTALMAVAIFGPFRKPIDLDDEPAAATPVAPVQHWPALVEATAIACDAAARIDLADALGALRSAWAESILRQAYETEPDPAVRSAIASALSSSQSLVT
jgi:hypothetical protein